MTDLILFLLFLLNKQDVQLGNKMYINVGEIDHDLNSYNTEIFLHCTS